MKICGIICEYNPFHNGHLYLLERAKAQTNADAIVCIMSGNFLQRGEAAVLDKYTRAKHAVLAGADAVIELPTPFATANAELFAKGAIHLLTSIPHFSHLCFGAENANLEKLIQTAKLLLSEPKEVSWKIKDGLTQGMSYAKARAFAWKGVIDESYLSSPNNILGVEYVKALLAKNSNAQILPIQRIGGGYLDENMAEKYSSATAIRKAMIENLPQASSQVPSFVEKDFPKTLTDNLETLEKFALFSRSLEEIASVCDCSEGLENAFKRCAEQNTPNLVAELTTSRYTASRIRRIALHNLLNIPRSLIFDGLAEPLYLNVLAAKKCRKDVLSALSKASVPLLTKYQNPEELPNTAKRFYQTDIFADKIFSIVRNVQIQKGDIFY